MKSKMIGLAESRAALRQLGPKVEKKVLNAALKAGARVIVGEIKADGRAPRSLTQAAAEKTATRNDMKNDIIKGDVYTGFKSPHHRLAHLFEFGTGPRFQKNGRYTGQMTATPFVRPAIDRGKGDAERKVRERIAAGVEREAAKLGKANKAR